MSLFKKKGVTHEEIVRQNDIKQNITKELSVCIQRLQQENHNTNEPILSTDSANAVCSVLEAVFLHNLKPSVSKKIAKYVGINQGYDNGGNNTNFWQFMDKFTHSDVVAQLKRLGQVTTEIGLCRVWIRVALNDGLMESYVDAMIADRKTLEYFYHSTAYLRDLEQPGILKNYLKGLMLFQFQLSYNSSVLNSWPNQSLVLAGVINPESTPLPVIHPAKDKRQTKSRSDEDREGRSDSGFTPVPVYNSRSKSSRSNSSETESSVPSNSFMNKSTSYKKSRNTNTEPFSPKENRPGTSDYSAQLTRNDIDEIRGMKSVIKSPSECSSSSHISHPDPVKYNINPAEYVRKKSADDVLFDIGDTEDADLMGNGYNADVPSPSNLQHALAEKITEDVISLVSDDQSVQEDGPIAEATVDLDTAEIHIKSLNGNDESGGGIKLEKSSEQNISYEDEYDLPSSYENQGSNQCNISDMRKEDPSSSTTVKNGVESTENQEISGNDTGITANGEDKEKISSVERIGKEISENWTEVVVDHKETETTDALSAKSESVSELVTSSSIPVEMFTSGSVGSPLIPREITEAENTKKLEDILSHEINDTADIKNAFEKNDINSSSDGSETEQKRKTKGAKASSSRRERLKPTLSPTQKEMVQPDLSPAVADSILTTGREGRFSPTLLMNGHSPLGRPRSGAMSVSEGHGKDDIGEMVSSPASIGNSLSGRSGWSSSFDADKVDPAEIYNGIHQHHGRDGIPIGRPKRRSSQTSITESFGTILQNYAPSSNVASPTLEDIIQELPDTGSYSSLPRSRDTPRHNSTSQEEYEIVSPPLAHINKDNPDKFTQHQLSLLGEIAVEKGLDSQNYQCGSCKRPIGLIYGKPRVCTYDGCYYCFECHENQEYYIPAFIVHNWDFRKHCVSKKSMQFLQDAEDQSTIDISEINPKLYEHVKEMFEAKALRRQLCHLRTYLFTCKKTIADEFRKALWPKDYLYDSVHMYTLCDLLQIPSGQFAQSMKKVIKFASKHVYSCPLCSGKGHICELCYSQKVIYPFEIENTTRCPKCKSVFHKVCKTEGKSCPKCERRNRRRTLSNDSLETPEIHDYAFSPLT